MARTIVYEPPRFSAVPWLLDSADLRPCVLPSTTVEHGASVTLGLLIPDPFGRGTTSVLRVTTQDWRGERVTLSITEVFGFSVAPKPRTTKVYPPPLENDCNELDDEP